MLPMRGPRVLGAPSIPPCQYPPYDALSEGNISSLYLLCFCVKLNQLSLVSVMKILILKAPTLQAYIWKASGMHNTNADFHTHLSLRMKPYIWLSVLT
jgi:hypothetical protein